MTRAELEHIVRAAGAIAQDDDIVVIGSQAILGQYPDAPAELLISREAGEGSPFERSFGYYAHGVGEETAVLPEGWRERLILVSNENTRHVRGWCLEVHDLAIAKLIAGREKGLNFLDALVRHKMAEPGILRERLDATRLERAIATLTAARLQAVIG